MSKELGTVGVVSGVAGALSSSMDAYFGAKAQKYQLRAQAAIMQANARIAELNARRAELNAQAEMQRGQHAITQLTLQTAQLKSRQKVGFAANGIDVGVGSAAHVQASADLMKEIDMEQIRINTIRSAWGHRSQAFNASMQARQQAFEAQALQSRSNHVHGGLQASTTLLTGLSRVAVDYEKYRLSKD